MITEEHLNHWLREAEYYLTGIEMEIAKAKLKDINGISILVDPTNTILEKANETEYVSFDYLREKAGQLRGQIQMIREDMKND